MDNIYFTEEGFEKLRKDLEFLKTVRRRELSKEIGKARAHGDIRENAEYEAAKEAQALNEKRISELESKLARGQILDDTQIPKDEILLGATVELEDMDNGQKIKYTLVSEAEGDFEQGKISITSPVGKGLLGHKKGDIVNIEVPAGAIKYKVLKISR